MAEIEKINNIIEETSPYYKKLKDKKLEGVPAEEHKIIYESSAEGLEPVYFWVLNLMNQLFEGKVEKLLDNFTSTPGSGHFSELMGKATKMQEEAMKILANVNTVIKSIINIIYDLKEWQILLQQYEDANSGDKSTAVAGLLSLKQRWLDQVDIKRGNTSIKALASAGLNQPNFVTLIDAFLVANKLEEVDKMDLNERVKRLLKPRLAEFIQWRKKSEIELTKRYEIEKTYLKSQVSALKLYTRWAKPYLRAATQLEQFERPREPALVNAFNTILLELTLLGKGEVDFEQAIIDKKLPASFKSKKLKRQYYSCVLVDFFFRGIPQRAGQHYVFGGRAEVTFRAYALNEEEIKMLNQKLDESDLEDALKLVSGTTDETLNQLQEDIKEFIEEEDVAGKEGKAKKEKNPEDVNPFSALFGLGKKKEEKTEKGEGKIEKVKADNYMENMVRKLAEQSAKERAFTLFDVYKKAHGMASHPSPEFEIEDKKVGFWDIFK